MWFCCEIQGIWRIYTLEDGQISFTCRAWITTSFASYEVLVTHTYVGELPTRTILGVNTPYAQRMRDMPLLTCQRVACHLEALFTPNKMFRCHILFNTLRWCCLTIVIYLSVQIAEFYVSITRNLKIYLYKPVDHMKLLWRARIMSSLLIRF